MTTKRTIEVDTIFGRIEAYEDDLITNQLIEFGAHTRPELAFLLDFIDSGDNVFDIGGHIGTFAIPIAKKIGPSGKILAVEALSETFQILQRNIDRFSKSANFFLENKLIAPPVDKLSVFKIHGNTGASYFSSEPIDSDSIDIFSSKKTSLDILFKNYFKPRIIKIDIEGYEYFALSIIPDFLSDLPIIYCEVSKEALERSGSSIDQLNEFFLGNQYRIFRNVGARNAKHDRYVIKELHNLEEGGAFFDVLAIHSFDKRIHRIEKLINESNQD